MTTTVTTTRYEQVLALARDAQRLADEACAKELDLIGAGPITLTYGDQLQDAADALWTVAASLAPVPASGVCLETGRIVSNQAHRIDRALDPDRAMNRLMRFETIGDEEVLRYADSGV